MKNEKHISVVRLTSLALLAALIVVLQTVASGIKIGPVPISLTLVPIVVGAILFGPGAGAFLGGVFGVVCLIAGIAGTDQFTNLLWVANPFCLTVICVGKAVLCGWVAGLVYRALEKPGMSVVLTVISLGTRVALAYLLSAIPAVGVVGIWWSVPIGWFLADMTRSALFQNPEKQAAALGQSIHPLSSRQGGQVHEALARLQLFTLSREYRLYRSAVRLR